jgi:hypothetical protein
MLWGLNEAGIAASQWVRYSSSQYQVFYIQPSFTKKKGSRYHVLLRYETKPESTRWARRGPFYVKDEVRLFEMDCATKTALSMEVSFFDEKGGFIDGFSSPSTMNITPGLKGPVPDAFRMLCRK